MPTENERKYIIDSKIESVIMEKSSSAYDISQGYLIATRGITVRIRKLVKRKNKKAEYYFTLKATTSGRAIELGIECLDKWGYTMIEEIVWIKTN